MDIPTTYTIDQLIQKLIDENNALKKEVEDKIEKQKLLKVEMLELGINPESYEEEDSDDESYDLDDEFDDDANFDPFKKEGEYDEDNFDPFKKL